MLVTADLPSRVGAQVAERLSRADLGRWLAQVQQVGACAQPIRMVGASDTINTATGEILRSYTSAVSRTGSPICGARTGAGRSVSPARTSTRATCSIWSWPVRPAA